MTIQITLRAHPQYTYQENYKGVIFRIHNRTGERLCITKRCKRCRYPDKRTSVSGVCLCPELDRPDDDDDDDVEQFNPKKHKYDPLSGKRNPTVHFIKPSWA